MEIRRSLPALFLASVKSYPRERMFLTRQKGGDWEPLSSRQALEAVHEIAGGLIADGLEPGDRVALISENRWEWVLSDVATHFCRGVDVPVYPTLPADQARYIIADAGARFVIVSSAQQAKKVHDERDRLGQVEKVYSMEEGVAGTESLAHLRERGRKYLQEHPGVLEERLASLAPDDLATLIYTSGTTGTPKGVMLTHKNFCSNVAAAAAAFSFEDGDLALSFLPLSHVLERMVTYVYLEKGATLAHVRRLERVADALREVRPHVFATVPRLLERAYDGVMEQVGKARGARRILAGKALRWADACAEAHMAGRRPGPLKGLRWKMADRVVLSKIREKLGGRLRFVISGGAAMPVHVGHFFWGVGIEVYEGYGLTETSPVLTANTPGHVRLGTVGRAFEGVELRLADDGEVVARGPNIMQGYWNRREETEEVLRGEWLYTGDLGRVDDEGYLTLTGRKKEIIVLSTGKNVGPRAVEAVLEKSPFVTQVIAVGDDRPSIGVLLRANLERLEAWAGEQGLAWDSPESLLQRPEVRDLFRREINSRQAHLAAYEKAHQFAFLPEELTEENGLLTPTQKVRRRQVCARYADLIEGMYHK
ncbi:MAG: long-chain fatty acid--CoA ligase [Acidobacteriota bacterium]|nr:long-chain fatty acid--CoA ligase [Acidobacteriota bacterium]MDQ7088744.1 long-chain fatty acid--CoA ligase [Acidobacteriota bacterium]